MKKMMLGTLLAALMTSIGLAQCASPMSKPEAAKTDSVNATFKTEYFAALDELEKKIVALAEAAPQEKYSWKPSADARPVGEVFTHMAAGNYSYARMAGKATPADVNPREFDKFANDKTKTIAELKKSFAFLRKTAEELSDADMNKSVKMYGRDSTVRNILLISVTHQSEHLGQSIAYARSIGVVPPWTVERQAAQKKAAAADASKK